MTGRQIKLVFVGVPPSMNQFNGRTNVQVYRAVKADWTDRVTWQARARRPKRPFERAEVLIEDQFSSRTIAAATRTTTPASSFWTV